MKGKLSTNINYLENHKNNLIRRPIEGNKKTRTNLNYNNTSTNTKKELTAHFSPTIKKMK